jgi:hypothetical protein
MIALQKSKHEIVRKKIIRGIRVAPEVTESVKKYVGMRLLDTDPEVRIESFRKIK